MDGNKEEQGQGAAPANLNEVRALIQTALYDTGGESVEGAFVDRWESYAGNAVDALKEIFERQGFSEADAELIRRAVTEPRAPLDAVDTLVSELGKWTLPLLESMLDDPSPRARLVAIRGLSNGRALWVSSRPLDPTVLLRGLEDTDAAVRETAVHTLAPPPVRKQVAQAEACLIHALDDEDPRVRIAAGSALDFFDRPEGSAALARRVEREPDEAVRTALLLSVAGKIQSAGVHSGFGGRSPLRERVGEPLLALLLRSLAHPEPPVRKEVASALHRLDGMDVAVGLLEHLKKEKDPEVRNALLYYPDRQYFQIAERALPVFASLLASDPSPAVRVQAVWVLKSCGPAALPLLLSALDDPFVGVRGAAARVLGMRGDLRSLPGLARALTRPARGDTRKELLAAIEQVTAGGTASRPEAPSPELAASIQGRIDALLSEGVDNGLVRACKEELNALPLHSTSIYLWALRPDGTVLCMDHEAFRRPVEQETDPLALFAALVQGAKSCPELEVLVPAPPRGVTLCQDCDGQGYGAEGDPDGGSCLNCRGLGWLLRESSPL